MRKFILCTLLITILTTIGIFKVNIKPYSPHSIEFENIEALATGEGGIEDCDITIYNRNEAETTEITTVRSEIGGGLYIIVNGVKINLGGDVHAGGSVKYFYCKPSIGNCCIKTWMEKPVEYL